MRGARGRDERDKTQVKSWDRDELQGASLTRTHLGRANRIDI